MLSRKPKGQSCRTVPPRGPGRARKRSRATPRAWPRRLKWLLGHSRCGSGDLAAAAPCEATVPARRARRASRQQSMSGLSPPTQCFRQHRSQCFRRHRSRLSSLSPPSKRFRRQHSNPTLPNLQSSSCSVHRITSMIAALWQHCWIMIDRIRVDDQFRVSVAVFRKAGTVNSVRARLHL